MNKSLLHILCCPEDMGELELANSGKMEAIVMEGTLRCTKCGEQYDIHHGIPVFAKSVPDDAQNPERIMREENVARLLKMPKHAVFHRISRSHWIPEMMRRAHTFANRFNSSSWIVDAGVGLGWHWNGVTSPNIVAIDFVLSNLLIAKRSFLSGNADVNVHLVCADLSRPPIKANVLNGAWSAQMLQHLPQDKLHQALKRLSTAMKPSGHLEVYWLNYSLILRLMYLLRGRPLPREIRTGELYTRRMSGGELKQILSSHFTGIIKVAYNEMLFHPELRVRHRLPLTFLDKAMAKVPWLNRALAHQVIAYIDSTETKLDMPGK